MVLRCLGGRQLLGVVPDLLFLGFRLVQNVVAGLPLHLTKQTHTGYSSSYAVNAYCLKVMTYRNLNTQTLRWVFNRGQINSARSCVRPVRKSDRHRPSVQ